MRFSIIVPFFNVEEFIRECLQSLVLQDYPSMNFEIIAVDDCSPDNSLKIVEDMMADYENIRLIRHTLNKHLGGARNTGLREAKGEWIFFVDSDDLWIRKDVLHNFESIINKTNCQIIRSTEMVRFNDSISEFNELQQAGYRGMEIESEKYFGSSKFFYNVWTSCYNRRFLIENNIFFREHHAYEDSDWTITALWFSKSLFLTDYTFYGYRSNIKSITSSPRLDAFEDNLRSVVAVNSLLKSYTFSDEFKSGIYKQIKKSLLSFIRIFRHYQTSDNIRIIRNVPDSLFSGLFKFGHLNRIEKFQLYLLKKHPGLVSAFIHTLIRTKAIFKRI